LARRFVKSIQTPVEAQLIEEIKPDVPPPPPPPPPKEPVKKTALPDYVPPVEIAQSTTTCAKRHFPNILNTQTTSPTGCASECSSSQRPV
jgi:hypothetical protein